jgi:hypothetical protein
MHRRRLLLSGDSELGRSLAAWDEADAISRRWAGEIGDTGMYPEVRSWLTGEALSPERVRWLASHPFHVRGLPPGVREWVEDRIGG